MPASWSWPTPTYDGRGNLTSAGNASYSYDLDNQLTDFSGGYIYRNALGEWLDVNTERQWMVYDGDRTIEEYGYDGTVHRRYVYGPGQDEPLVWYEGSDTSDRRFLHADERGSIVAVSDNAGNTVGINTYDEYGIPGSSNIGRFQYTGQRWIPALGMYDYKARMYSPTMGRFLQTDPIGYADGMNWYNYAGGDPINFVDPSGLVTMACGAQNMSHWDGDTWVVQSVTTYCDVNLGGGGLGGYGGGAGLIQGGGGGGSRGSVGTQTPPATTPQNKQCSRASVLGKVWSSPNSALGLIYGGAGAAVSGAAYGLGLTDKAPSVGVGHNAIEFSNNLFASAGAVTVGNVSVYGSSPSAPLQGVSQGWQHEIRHTGQGEVLGPLYLPAIGLSWAVGLIRDGDIHGPHSFLESGSGKNAAIPWGC